MKKIFFTFCIYLSFSGFAYCGDILPKFMGYYTNNYLPENQYYKNINLTELSSKNTCAINEHIDKRKDYKNKIKGSYQSILSYAASFDPSQLFDANPGHYKSCVFRGLEVAVPRFFLEYPGSFYEVNTSLEQTPLYNAHYLCYRDNQRQPDPYPDNHMLQFVPIYQCPEGYTSFSFNDGCLKNEKLLCPGDVVGRNLDIKSQYIPSFVKKQGHVGLAVFHLTPYERDSQYELENRGIKVAEMLGQDDAGLHFSLFSDFKEKVKDGYWGAKYGTVENAQPMSMIQYNSLTKLLDYISEDEVIYTWSWIYSVRNVTKSYVYNPYIDKATVTQWYSPSKFRCDTFVKYIYEKGAGIKLNLNKFFSPKDLFGYLIFPRDKAGYFTDNSFFKESCNGSFSEIKENIKLMIHPNNYQQLYDLDLCMQSFIQFDEKEQEKIQFLWKLYNDEQDLFTKKYLLDNLVNYNTLQYTDNIIDSFQSGYFFYDELYELLFKNIRFNSEAEIYNLSSEDIENIKKTYDFLGLTEDDFPENTFTFKSKDRRIIKKKSMLKNHLS
ncbi:hypothetical protein SC260_15065 [Legionella pneumophila serogroup 1]